MSTSLHELPVLHFHPCYRHQVLGGEKRTTIRYNTSLTTGAVALMFGEDTTCFPGQIIHCEQRALSLLNDTDAREDGFADSDELLERLRFHYPGLPADAQVSIIRFKLAEAP